MKQLLLFFISLIFSLNYCYSQVPASERNALIDLYNSTNGNQWFNNTNWNSANPISTWYGVGLQFIDGQEHVISINAGGNNLTGYLPNEILNLPYLREFYIYSNNLSNTIPDLSSLPLVGLDIEDNNYVFGDFENEFTNYQALGSNFYYQSQNLTETPTNEAVAIGNSKILSANISGSQNNYYWYKDGFVLPGETNATLNVTINTASDYGNYYYSALSNIVTGLVLQSHNFTIAEAPSNNPDYDALVAIYNSTNGNNWTTNTNWLDNTKPLSTWHGVTLTNGRVSQLVLQGNNLTGVIPSEIGDLTELTFLDLFLNNLTGEIPQELWNLSKMETMYLGQKSKQLLLTGGIPPEISNLQELFWLNLTGVPLTQPLQPELFLLPKLDFLRIVECGLTGTLPKELAQIDNVLAGNNEFEGTIPQEIINSVGNFNLSIQNNYFDFNDLEPLVLANNYNILNYTPQRTKDMVQNLDFAPGSDITLSIDDTRLNKTKHLKGTGDLYQWYKDNVAINGANASSYILSNAQVTDSGIYYCQITNNLVSDLVINRANITLNIDASLSVNETPIVGLNIYPNPIKDILTIKLNDVQAEQFILLDLNGKQILNIKSQTENTIIDISNLDSGVYLLKIKTPKNIITKRIIKQ